MATCDYPGCSLEAEHEVAIAVLEYGEKGKFSRLFCEECCFSRILSGPDYNDSTMGEFFALFEPPDTLGL